MAISFQAHANGVRAAGSSFTIALSSTAGDQIIVAVATPSNGTTVSSITDGGGNAYTKKGSLVNGTTENCELWASSSAHPAASGTITVNLSASAVACGCAASYRGVDIVTIPAATSTGSTSPITSGATTLLRPSAWLVTAGGLAAANAFTAQNGSIRDQVTSTAVASVIIDSNGAASPVTDSATMTAANWSQVSVQLWAGITVPFSSQSGAESYYELENYYVMGEAESGPPAVRFTTIGSWFGRDPINTKTCYFSQSAEDVNPGIPIPLPLISGWNPPNITNTAFNKATQSGSLQPDKVLPFSPLIGIFISAWQSQESYCRLNNFYTQVEPAVRPLGYPATFTLNSWFSTDGQKSLPQRYVQSYLDAPAKFGLVVVATANIAGWTSTIGQNSVALKYAPTDSVNQVRPTLAVLPILTFGLASQPPNALPQKFALTDWQAPPKFGLVTPVLSVIAWQFQEPYYELENYYVMGEAESGPVIAFILPTLLSSLTDFPPNAQPQKYALTSWDAPDKFTVAPPVVTLLAGWSSIETYAPKFDWFAMGDTSTGPAVIFSASFAFASAIFTPWAVVNRYALSEYTSPVRGLVVAAPPTLSNWSPTTGQNAVVLKYAASEFSAPAKFGLVVVVSPTLASWTPTIGQNAVVLNYRASDSVNQIRPTLATLPTLLFGLSEIPPNAQPQKYAPTSWDAPAKSNIIPTLPFISWTPNLDRVLPTLSPDYASSDYVSGSRLQILSISWFDDKPWSTFGKYQQIEIARQISPTLATLPILLFGLAETPPNAQPQKYTPASWDAPAKFGLTVAAPITVVGWSPTLGQNAVVLKYATTDFVNQTAPTLATLPFISWVPNLDRVLPTLSSDYASSDYVSGIAPKAALPFISWTPNLDRVLPTLSPDYASSDYVSGSRINLPFISWLDDKPWSTFGKYQQIEIARQIAPTLATMPILLFGLAEIPPNAQPQKFASVAWDAPAKFGLTVAAPITVAGWSPTIGQGSVVLKYALTDFVNQINPTLFPLPLFTSELTKPAQNAVVLNHALTAYDAPPKFGLVAPAIVFVSGWTPTTGQQAVILRYAPVAFDTPPKFGLSFVPLISGWLGTDGQKAFVPTFNAGDIFTSPGKFNLVIPPVVSWSIETGQKALPQKFSPTEISHTLFPIIAALPLLTAELTKPAQNAVVLNYAPVAYDAPAKFGLVFTAPVTLDNWSPTIGQQAVVLRYAISDWQAPPKFGLIVAVLPTINSWTPTIGQKSLPQSYASVAFDSPSKFALISIPVVVIKRGVVFYKLIAANSIFNLKLLRPFFMD